MYVQAVASELVRRAALRDDEFRQRSVTDAELWVERDVWAEVVELVECASTMLHASARQPRSEGTVHVNMTAVLFGMTERAEGRER